MFGSPWQPKCCKWWYYYFYACSLTTSVLISLRLTMFQWSFDATHMKHTYRCARVWWTAPILTPTSSKACVISRQCRFCGRLQLRETPWKAPTKAKQVCDSSSDREKQRNKQGAKKGNVTDDNFFPALCFLVKKLRKMFAAGRAIYS